MEVKRKIKKFFKNKIVRIVALALIVLAIIFLITYNPKEDLDTTYIIAKFYTNINCYRNINIFLLYFVIIS